MATPDKIYVCTKGNVASDFQAGIIFGSPKPSPKAGTVEYVRADLVAEMMPTEHVAKPPKP